MLGMRVSLSLHIQAQTKGFPKLVNRRSHILGARTGVEREGASFCSGAVGVACSFLHAEPTARLNILQHVAVFRTKTNTSAGPTS